MNYYKPYSYLYKSVSDPEKLKSCFVAWLPAGKNIGSPTIVNHGSVTTISYSIVADPAKERDWRAEAENELDWNGSSHDVTVVIGSGSGGTGGKSTLNSDGAENL